MVSMNLRFTISLLLIGLLYSACQKDLVINHDDFESRLVVNSIFTTGKAWSISVTNSSNLLDPDSKIEGVEGAQIFLENRSTNVDVPIIDMGNGNYVSNGGVPQEGDQYEIFISKEGYETARSLTYVPSNAKAPEMFNIEEIDNFDEKVYKVSLKIQDDPNQQNYFVWELISSSEENAGAVFKGEDADQLAYYLDRKLPKNQPKLGALTALSSDGAFSGEIYSQDIFIVPDKELVTDGPEQTETQISLYLKVKSVSQDLYKYHESFERHEESADYNTIYSNVENGYGIFGSYNESVIKIDL